MASNSSNLLLAYYGDDFTGSTDVMEALSQAGLRTVLFLEPPSKEQLDAYDGLRAYGIAGGSRAMTVAEMETHLPPAFDSLKSSGAPIVHYKMCSTMDSSAYVGSIGKAIEIGRQVFGDGLTPLVVGAPVLARYVAFGNLFARSGLDSEPFRLDRHPTMRQHPVTPMRESDIRLILKEQTSLPVELIDCLTLDSIPDQVPSFKTKPSPIVLFDTVRNEHLPVIGKMLDSWATGDQLFTVGSSGVEYALVEYWKQSGQFSDENSVASSAVSRSPDSETTLEKRVPSICCVSGSCSPVTDRQIRYASDQGWMDIGLCPEELIADGDWNQVIDQATMALDRDISVIFHSSRGPEDPRVLSGLGESQLDRLCRSLSNLLERLINRTGCQRAVVCGGDTSMRVARELGIKALEYLGPMAPGSPLCRVHAPGRIVDGGEFVFKGGQVGRDRFFLDVLQGYPC